MNHSRAEKKLYSIARLRMKIKNCEAARDRLIRQIAPSGIAPIDMTKPRVKSSKPEDDFSAADKIAHYQQQINEMNDLVSETTAVVDQLCPEERKIIVLWYFRGMKAEQIAKELHYSGTSTIYRRRHEALENFDDLFPW